MVDVVVFIQFDSKSIETSWMVERGNGQLVAQGGSHSPFVGDNITQLFSVEADQEYAFIIYDAISQNRICCEYGFGQAYVYLGNKVPSIKTHNVLVHNDGVFGDRRWRRFFASSDAIIDVTMRPTSNPTVSASPTPLPTPLKPKVPISIAIRFDDAPEEVGWCLAREGPAVYRRRGPDIVDVSYGTYTSELSSQMVPTIVELDADRTYEMSFSDNASDGYCCGKGEGNITVYVGTEPSAWILSNLVVK